MKTTLAFLIACLYAVARSQTGGNKASVGSDTLSDGKVVVQQLCNSGAPTNEISALKKEIKQLKEELLQRLDEKFSKGKESNKNSDHDFFHTSSHCIVRNLTSTYCRFRLDIECFNLCSTTVLIAIRIGTDYCSGRASHFILLLLLLSQPYRVKKCTLASPFSLSHLLFSFSICSSFFEPTKTTQLRRIKPLAP